MQQGIAATTIAQIAEAAAIRPPAIYRHFPSKDALLVALARRDFCAEF